MERKYQRNIKLIVAYDGGRYHGFQRQNNAVSVQNILEEKLSIVFGGTVKLAASGRTDTGVHALGQVVSFITEGTIPIDRVVRAVNSHLPDDIVVKTAEEADISFHARYSAVSKTYIYRIQQGETLDPFQRHYVWYIRNPLDVEGMKACLPHIVGTHDFSAFQAAGGVQVNPIRTIYHAECVKRGDIVEFLFFGNGFLYHMVRNLVGTLVNVGKRKITPEAFQEILAGRDRRKAGMTAPAQGLYLKQVDYS